MIVRLYKRPEISDTRWDAFINASPQKILYTYSWYLDIVSPDWCAFVVENANEWVAVMPVPVIKKFGITTVKQPLFSQFLRVFYKTEIQDFSNILFEAFQKKFHYVSSYAVQSLNLDKVSETKQTHVLDLNQPYETIAEGYNKDRYQNLKRALSFEQTIFESNDIEPIISLFKQNHVEKIEGGVSEKAYQLLREIYNVLLKKQAVRLLYVSIDGTVVAGAMFAVYAQRIIYLFNAASEVGRMSNARTLLIDRILKQYSEQDFIFDFESPDIENIKGFYESFGAKPQFFSYLRYNHLAFPLKQIQNLRLKSMFK